MKYLRLILRNLLRNKRRTALTVFSIAVSLFVFSALISLPTVVDRILATTVSSVRINCHNKAGLTYPLPESYRHKILAVKHVEKVASWTWFGGVYTDINDQFPNFGVDHEELDQIWPDWEIDPESMAALKTDRTACLVGRGLVEKFHWRVGQQIMLRGSIWNTNLSLKIVGVLHGKSPPTFLLFRRDYLLEATGRQGFVGNYWVKVDKPDSIPGVIAELDETFANSDAETQSESEASFFGSFLAGFKMFFTLAEVLAIIVVATIGLVAANTAAMSIRERRSEIGVLRSLGFSKPLIMTCLLGECLAIGVIGGLVGCTAAYLFLRTINLGMALGPIGMIPMPPSVLGESLIVASFIGIFSGLVPAMSAARRSIVDTLRVVA